MTTSEEIETAFQKFMHDGKYSNTIESELRQAFAAGSVATCDILQSRMEKKKAQNTTSLYI